jgi:hypothetical protein
VKRFLCNHSDEFTDLASQMAGIFSPPADGTTLMADRSRGDDSHSCAALTRDFTPEEREQYDIRDEAPTCPEGP